MIHWHLPRRVALTQLYTVWLSWLKCSHTRCIAIDNHTGSTSCSLTRWHDQHTFDKVGHYSIYRPWKYERLSWPSRLTYTGWLTHISDHPSAIVWAFVTFGSAKYCDQYVCLSVCLSFCLLISKTTHPNFIKFSVCVTCGHVLVLLWQQYVMYFRFVDNVMEQMGQS